MRSPRRAALVLAVVTLCLAGPRADEPAVAPFTLAVVRQDGILTPFVTWTGKAFANTWPVPEKEVDTPITMDEVPRRWWGRPGPPTQWHVWQPDGATSEVRMTTPAWYPAHCQQGIGVRTSLALARPAPPARIQPYPKLGVASTRRLDFKPIESLGPESSLARALANTMQEMVNREEDTLVKSYIRSAGWMHPVDAAARRAVPLRIEALYRAPAAPNGLATYYFEGVKRYAAPSAAADRLRAADRLPCEVVTFIYGWFALRGEEKSMHPRVWETRLTSCDYESVDVMLPMAYVMLRDKPLWIVQFSGWGRERYAVIDTEATDAKEMIAWASHGGLCPLDGGEN